LDDLTINNTTKHAMANLARGDIYFKKGSLVYLAFKVKWYQELREARNEFNKRITK
jgi:hypothetical protein